MSVHSSLLPIYNFKLVLLGESGVGKTSIAGTFCGKGFNDFQDSTIGAAFQTQKLELHDRNIRFEIWDTAGQERYHSLAPMYYRGAKSAIVTYEITSTKSFERAKSWVKELQESSNVDIVIALAGNKCDMESNRRVEKETAEKYADENGLFFFETSAKKLININEIFRKIAENMPYDTLTEETENSFYIDKNTKSRRCCY